MAYVLVSKGFETKFSSLHAVLWKIMQRHMLKLFFNVGTLSMENYWSTSDCYNIHPVVTKLIGGLLETSRCLFLAFCFLYWKVVGIFKCHLPFCECRWGGGSIWRWLAHLNPICCNSTYLNFLHSEVVFSYLCTPCALCTLHVRGDGAPKPYVLKIC